MSLVRRADTRNMHGSRPLRKILLPLALAQAAVLAVGVLAPSASASVSARWRLLSSSSSELGSELSADAIALRGVSQATTSGVALSVRVNAPAGLLAGDLMVASLSVRLPASGVIQAPSGWQLVRRDTNAGGASLSHAVYYKVANSFDAGGSYSWSFSSSVGAAVGLLAFSRRRPGTIRSGSDAGLFSP